MNDRITVILGAGATVDATHVSTDFLTKKVINNCQKYTISDNDTKSIVDEICSGLQKKKCPNPILLNFEVIYHILELLLNYIQIINLSKFIFLIMIFLQILIQYFKKY